MANLHKCYDKIWPHMCENDLTKKKERNADKYIEKKEPFIVSVEM